MNMKKTFAGAMAGALAVSAMATSASASIPGPGEYTVDLTKEAEFFATVQFTFDADYMLDAGTEKVTLNVTDSTGKFNMYGGVAELSVDFIGSTGVKTQTVKYNSTWDSADFYSWYFTLNNFEIPVCYNTTSALYKQGLYASKYNTVKEALAVAMSDGSKKYPVVVDADLNEVEGDLDHAFFDKIVVTAKIPMNGSSSLSDLNSVDNSFKAGLRATMDGITPIDIYEIENEEAVKVRKELNELLDVKAKLVTRDAKKADLTAALADLNTLLGTAYDADNFTTATVDALAKSETIPMAAATKIEKASLALAAYTNAMDAIPDGYKNTAVTVVEDKVKDLSDILETYKAVGTSVVGVDIRDDMMAIAETKFLKYEANKVGVKSGIVVDNNVVKTVSGDIGAWKPDALRIIADAIADNEGVTLTFTAKDTFDDAAYRAWIKELKGQNLHWTSAGEVWATESAKEDYESWGVSMFTGAIVLNRDFSKQFSQAGLVDWGTNTITFDWDELTEGRFYDASIVLHSMELLSTQNVEWVSCTVVVPEQADAEKVDPSQGKEDESNEINDTPVTEAPEVITEAPATEAPAPATEAPAPVAPVTNPTTGNAPVALAVIPVALAAAAIVAKKRG